MMDGLSRMIREYGEERQGRISWRDWLYLWIDKAGKRKRCERRSPEGPIPFRDMEQAGRIYTLFKGRSAQCHHIQKWNNDFPIVNKDKRHPYVTVPAAQCKTCEFHESRVPYSRFRKFACCKWFRDNSGMPPALQLLSNAVNDANKMLG